MKGRSEEEQVALGLAALVTVVVEPVTYLFYTIHWVSKHGWVGLLLLTPLALGHLLSWLIPMVRKKRA